VLKVRGIEIACFLTIGDVTFVENLHNREKSVSIHIKSALDTQQTSLLYGIDTEDMIFIGTFSDNKDILSIGCYSVHDEVKSGNALPHLSIDWASKTMLMPMTYYQSIFLDLTFPSSKIHVFDDFEVGSIKVPENLPCIQEYDQIHTPSDASDLPSMSLGLESLKDMKHNTIMDILETISLDLPMIHTIRSTVQSVADSVDQSVLQSVVNPVSHKGCGAQSLFVMDPNSMYLIRFNGHHVGMNSDALIREWEASYSRQLGCSICELIDMRLRYREQDVYVSQAGVFEFTKVSPRQLDEYFVKRYHILNK